jgi:putative transposase
MKKSKFTEEQIAFALRQAASGTRVAEVCRKMGISGQTFFRWKKKYWGLGVSELRRLRQLEEENRQLKRLVADLTPRQFVDKYKSSLRSQKTPFLAGLVFG